VVLAVRYQPHRHATVGQIPGALQVQRFPDLGANDELPILRLPSRAAFEAKLRRWGVNDHSTIVVYDGSVTAPASWALLLLDLYGVDGQPQRWKSIADLAAVYKDLPKDGTVIAYCHEGFRSTPTWLQPEALGYKEVRVENGGWSDWDRTLTLPVVKGAKAFDADFEL